MPKLADFVTRNKDEIIAACRVKVSQRSDPPDLKLSTDHGVPVFLDQLVEELKVGLSGSPDIALTAERHGSDLLRQGYSIGQVVHGYGDVCQAITELALAHSTAIGTDDFRMLNRCADDAIAAAVSEYAHESDQHTDGEASAENDRVESLALQVRRLIRTATAALGIIKEGSIGVSGSTGKVLATSLADARIVIDAVLDEVRARRPKHDAQNHEGDQTRKNGFVN
jgi:hypothetical protein